MDGHYQHQYQHQHQHQHHPHQHHGGIINYAPPSSSSGSASTISDIDHVAIVNPQPVQNNNRGQRKLGAAPVLKANGKPATKRASRAGERSVAKLNPSQLARKRANDRDAQRAIRQRTKEHVESLEKRIEELSSANGESEALKQARDKNRELEEEIKSLKSVIRSIRGPGVPWTSQTTFNPSPAASFVDTAGTYPNVGMSAATSQPVTTQAFAPTFGGLDGPLTSNGAVQYDSSLEDEDLDLGLSSDLQTQRSWIIPTSNVYANSFTAFAMDNQYQDSMLLNSMNNQYTIPSSFINQPSTSCWELPIQYLPPVGPIDSLLVSILHQQRMAISNGNNTRALSKPANYRNLLFMDMGDGTASSDPISSTIATVLHATAMQKLPEKVASLWAIHKLLRWQISPGLDTYESIPDWFSPRPSQLVKPHASWVSQVKFPKLRDKIINNQELYANDEFLAHYTGSLTVNWPYQDIDILTFVGGEVRITPMFERHICKLSNWMLGPPFTLRYPELEDVCNFVKPDLDTASVQEWADS